MNRQDKDSRKEACAISHILRMKKEEKLRAGCNICIAIVILGLLMIVFTNSKAWFLVAFIIVSIGIGVGMVLAATLEYLRWNTENEDLQRQIEEQDKQAIKAGKFNYILENEDGI